MTYHFTSLGPIHLHELSISRGIVDICEQYAGNRRVLSVTLELGALSGVVPEALEFCFEASTKGTLLEGARLDIERIAAIGFCRECGRDFPLEAYFDPCPECSAHLEIRNGEEMRVKDLEVE
jgi:hydrogenase nickel incorporation protein HypA/HybF